MIRGFTVGVGATTDLTVDFDVRKSIVEPPGQRGADPLVCDGQAYLLSPYCGSSTTCRWGRSPAPSIRR
jgi:hypothetical protein